MVWIYTLRRRPVKVQLRPYVTWPMTLFSIGLFVIMTLLILTLYLQKREVHWPIVGYFLLTGFLINCFVTTSRRPGESKPPGESERLKLLFGVVVVPIVILFYPFGSQRAGGSLLNNTMTFLSFRSPPGQLVRLNEQAYHKVMAIAAYTGITIHPCEIAKDFWVLRE
jgi:hypothetical protein